MELYLMLINLGEDQLIESFFNIEVGLHKILLITIDVQLF